MPKCYIVTFEEEIMVLASSSKEAKEIAKEAIKEEYPVLKPSRSFLADRIANGWYSDCLVYNNDNMDITVEEALRLNAADEDPNQTKFDFAEKEGRI